MDQSGRGGIDCLERAARCRDVRIVTGMTENHRPVFQHTWLQRRAPAQSSCFSVDTSTAEGETIDLRRYHLWQLR